MDSETSSSAHGERATQQVSNQKSRATDGLGTIASAVRQSAQPLRDQHHTIASYVGKAADQLDRLSSTFRDRDVPELLQDARRFARERPAVFIGASFAAGLMAARFLKSSAENDEGYGHQYYADRQRARRGGRLDGGW